MTFPATPWRAAPYSSIVGVGVVGQSGRVVATVPTLPSLPDEYKREAEAIARLIASAPKLYALLERASECVHDELADEIDAELAKARGES